MTNRDEKGNVHVSLPRWAFLILVPLVFGAGAGTKDTLAHAVGLDSRAHDLRELTDAVKDLTDKVDDQGTRAATAATKLDGMDDRVRRIERLLDDLQRIGWESPARGRTRDSVR